MSSSENSSLLPFILISSVVVICGYLFITKMLTDNVSKANPKPQVEELTTALGALRSAQEEAAKPAENEISTPLTPAATKIPANNVTDNLQSQLKKQEQQRNEMMRSLKGASDK
ncbi:hypothetical protein [Rubritalea profundi]|uniref:Uncharacterized protein n=1 Tax=Rubritalea profundi TaxID=1658618 RepID=A0A2S7U0T1_9BACT|nr:hypothetical protein [Rubritalea profundi]PQJ28619.1 hypothetical protein BSZ32_08960 [Rubritalea profundi]